VNWRCAAPPSAWEAGEKLVVAVSARPGAAAAVRYARRLADRLRASWTAVHVETGAASEAERDRVAQALRLAERMGGMAATVAAASEADGVIQFARANNATHVVTMAARGRWPFTPDLTRQLLKRAPDINLHVVPAPARAESPREKLQPPVLAPRAIAGALATSAVALGVGLLLRQTLAVSNVALVLMVAVLASAVTFGLVPSLFACVVLALAYNFFFLPPLYTFTIAEPENIVTLLVFMR
jgi:two-component system, OmpR family, sensor histidine kinase KdpD